MTTTTTYNGMPVRRVRLRLTVDLEFFAEVDATGEVDRELVQHRMRDALEVESCYANQSEPGDGPIAVESADVKIDDSAPISYDDDFTTEDVAELAEARRGER